MEPERRWLLIASLIAVAAQIIIAPNITIADATPNFIVAFVIVVALLHAGEQHYVLAFVMGLVYDLLGNGPLGATSLCLLVAVFAISFLVEYIGTDNLTMTLVLMFLIVLAVDIVYGIFLISAGSISFVDGMVYRALPCAFYDTAIAIIFYLIMIRFSTPDTGHRRAASTPNLRFH